MTSREAPTTSTAVRTTRTAFRSVATVLVVATITLVAAAQSMGAAPDVYLGLACPTACPDDGAAVLADPVPLPEGHPLAEAYGWRRAACLTVRVAAGAPALQLGAADGREDIDYVLVRDDGPADGESAAAAGTGLGGRNAAALPRPLAEEHTGPQLGRERAPYVGDVGVAPALFARGGEGVYRLVYTTWLQPSRAGELRVRAGATWVSGDAACAGPGAATVTVMPNPARGRVVVAIAPGEGEPAARTYALRLVDAAGRVALAHGGLRAGAQAVDVSGVAAGTYAAVVRAVDPGAGADRGAVLSAEPLRVE